MQILKTIIKFNDGSHVVYKKPVEVKSVNKYRTELEKQSTDIKSVLFEYTNEPLSLIE